jgi:hypothetical protein
MKKIIKSLRTLIKVRERRHKKLEEALVAAKVLLQERQTEVDNALNFLTQCQNNERSARSQRDDLVHRTFNPDKLIALDYRVEVLVEITVEANKALDQRNKALQMQHEAVAEVQRDIRRNLQRIDSFKERIKSMMLEQELLIEEAAEEETEETSTARFCSRQRSAKVVEYGQ